MMIRDHRAVPGPDYWSWRCLSCGEPVRDHAGWCDVLLDWIRR